VRTRITNSAIAVRVEGSTACRRRLVGFGQQLDAMALERKAAPRVRIRKDRRISVAIDGPYLPTGLYGVSKAFGETLGRLYAAKFGLSVICLRIAAFQPRPRDHRQLLIWISPRDLAQLTIRALEAPDSVRYLSVFGVSANDRNPYDRQGWDLLGYVPQDNSESFVGSGPSLQGQPVLPSDFYLGGQLCVPDDKAIGGPPKPRMRPRCL
jgi:hypothetical protein